VLAPGGIGNMAALLISGRLVRRVDQRMMLGFGCALNAIAFVMMTNVTLSMDYWSLAFPRFVQGFGQGFVFVPLQTLALSTIPMERLSNATSAFNVVRNFGGSMGIALATTLLARRSQVHQAKVVEHANLYEPETQHRLRVWTDHFLAQGADTFTASRRALAMLYRDAVGQAQTLAYIDVYSMLVVMFTGILFLLPWMRRVRLDQAGPRPGKEEADGRVEGLPAAASE
jgi:DHA2 family multidrug resistance protein